MQEIHTWRTWLGQYVIDYQGRVKIARDLGVHPITLTRWITGKSTPRSDSLRPLLDIFSEQREHLLELIIKEFPHFAAHQSSSQDIAPGIPREIYAHIMSIYATSPGLLRTTAIRMQILQYMLDQLDPQQQGFAIAIMQYSGMAESAGQKVQSMRKACGQAVGMYEMHHESWAQLFGVESQLGDALMKMRPSIIQTRQEKQRTFAVPCPPWEESSVAYPLFQGDESAGCLYLSSIYPYYFTPPRLELIRNYTELLLLGFDAADFYHVQQIDLRIMPSYEQQRLLLAGFHQRVTQRLIQAARVQQYLTRPQAEKFVWQELEQLFQRSMISRQV